MKNNILNALAHITVASSSVRLRDTFAGKILTIFQNYISLPINLNTFYRQKCRAGVRTKLLFLVIPYIHNYNNVNLYTRIDLKTGIFIQYLEYPFFRQTWGIHPVEDELAHSSFRRDQRTIEGTVERLPAMTQNPVCRPVFHLAGAAAVYGSFAPVASRASFGPLPCRPFRPLQLLLPFIVS